MTARRDLLIEIGSEELPPRSLQQLAVAFAEEIHNGLLKQNLAHGRWLWFATPRRLAVTVSNLVLSQPDHEQVRRGPALAAAYDAAGKPTRALEGFARSCNAGIEELETETTDKGSWVIHRRREQGRAAADLLPDIIDTALARLPISRRMRWGDSDAEFVRPVHWSVVLLGRDIIPCRILDTRAGNASRGHRFHHPRPVRITSARNYAKKLRDKGFVIADFNERKAAIRQQVTTAASAAGYTALIDDDLLDEVASLVEWPVAITGAFDREFLDLPREVLLATLQDQQKYFPLVGSDNKLTAAFITVANIDSKAPDEVRRGNERVIRPRLNDAAFFWRRDGARPLADYCPGLGDVVYQKELGTLADRTERLRRLSVFIASRLGLEHSHVERAAALAKCDLLTDMVGEFPKLQGTMGRHYAIRSGESDIVAQAIEEQYLPRLSGGPLPQTDAGRILSIADRIETLVGFFGIGQEPTGDKDPFGLRRAALGLIRIFIENGIPIPLFELIEQAWSVFDGKIAGDGSNVEPFIYDRLAGYMKSLGYTALEVDAVICLRQPMINLIPRQLEAVREFCRLPEAESLVAANKRVANIIRQAESRGEVFNNITPEQLQESAERDLFRILQDTSADADILFDEGDFTGYLKSFAVLKEPVDNFFDTVMVMVEDAAIRSNRLALLNDLRTAMNKVADIARLQA